MNTLGSLQGTKDFIGLARVILLACISILSEGHADTWNPSSPSGYIIPSSSSSSVGIGSTSNPDRKLRVTGAGGVIDAISMFNGFLEIDGVNIHGAASGGTSNLRIGYFTSSRVGFNLQGNEAITILTNGNVGIGTSNPGNKLTVAGSVSGSGFIRAFNGFLEVDGVNSGGAASGGTNNLRIGYFSTGRVGFNLQGSEVLSLKTDGKVGVGTPVPSELFEVNGNIKGTNIIATNSIVIKNWTVDAPDYVFERGYKIRTLPEVEAHVNSQKHLPDMPSAKEFKEKGVDILELNYKLLQKVEELTLYAIEQEKRIDRLEQTIQKKGY